MSSDTTPTHIPSARTLVREETVSEPGARVVETEYTLAYEVLRQLRVQHPLPAALTRPGANPG